MKRTTKLTIGLAVATLATKTLVSNIVKMDAISNKRQDKINYDAAEKLILKAEQIRESEAGQKALFDNSMSIVLNKEEALKTLDIMDKMYDYAQQYIDKIYNKETDRIYKVEILIKRRKKVIEHRRIILK